MKSNVFRKWFEIVKIKLNAFKSLKSTHMLEKFVYLIEFLEIIKIHTNAFKS